MGATATITIRPIHSEADYRATLAEIATLMAATPGSPEAERLDVLATLVEAYEAKHYPMDPPDPIEAIRFRMDQQGLTPQDLEPFIGSRARVSEVLNRRRPLSLAMIRRLTEGLGVPAAVLIRPTGAPSARKPEARGARKQSATTSSSKRAGVKRDDTARSSTTASANAKQGKRGASPR